MKKKTILARTGGDENPELKEIEIKKGTEAGDILRALDVPLSYQIFRQSTNTFLQPGRDVFSELEDGEKVVISPPTDIAGGVWDRVSQTFSSFFNGNDDEKVRLVHTLKPSLPPRLVEVQTQEVSPPRRTYSRPVQVELSENLGLEAQLLNRGWKRDGKNYVGWIHGNNGDSFFAALKRRWGNRYELFVKNPPACVFTGKHRFCFIPRGDGWYFVHFKRQASPLTMLNHLQAYVVEEGGAL